MMNDGPPFSSFSDNANDNAVLGIGCYIILKRHKLSQWQFFRLGTIYLYIILKLLMDCAFLSFCLNTIYLYIILKPQIQK